MNNNIKTMKKIKRNYLVALLTTIVFTSSCEKDSSLNNINQDGQGTVTINLQGIGSSSYLAKGFRATKASPTSIQQQSISFGDYSLSASLQEVQHHASFNTLNMQAKAITDAEELEPGTEYTVIFKPVSSPISRKTAASSEPHRYTFTYGKENDKNISLPSGTYEVMTTAWGNSSATDPSDRDPLASKKQTLEVQADANHTLNTILYHQLTAVRVIFDASVAGPIDNIQSGTIKPNTDYTFDESTGEITSYGNKSNSRSLSFDPNQKGNKVWTSKALLIASDTTDNAEIYLENITIGGKTASIVKGGWHLEPGTQYELTIHVIPKHAIEIPGLPIYVANANINPEHTALEKDQYSPGGVFEGKGNEDYCSFLGDGWKTPSKSEFAKLITLEKVSGKAPNGQEGWFFGTNNKTLAEQHPNNYIFLPFNDAEGKKNGNKKLPEGVLGGYWIAEGQGHKNALLLYQDKVEVVNADDKTVHQNAQLGIRCVRTK